MSKRNKTIQGFVLGVSAYREFDGFVTFLSDEYGLIRLVIRGLYRPKSKQMRLALEFSQVEYQLNYKEDALNTIISGDLIEGYIPFRQSYDWIVSMSLLSEVIQKTYLEMYLPFYLQSLESVAKDYQNLLNVLVAYIRELGIAPHIESCIHCDSKQFVDFSIEEGGFLCKNHASSAIEKVHLLAIYRIFSLELVPEQYLSRILTLVIRYLEYHNDIMIKSYQLFMNEER